MKRSLRTVFCLGLVGACAGVRTRGRELVLPPRVADAETGSQLLVKLRGLSLAQREAEVWREVGRGNVPAFLKDFVPVKVEATVQGRRHTATFWCAPDYFGLGDDDDWFRMPIAPQLAQCIADRFDCVLPTRAMVDAIWAQADVKLSPFPFSPKTYDILAVDLFHEHHVHIEAQRAGRPQHLLVAGIKKDVVSSALIAEWPDRVVIYGWHHPDGKAIQPLWKGHTQRHVDYSHGVRLVARAMEVDGEATTVDAVLGDAELHVLVSDEGPIRSPRYRVAATVPGH